MASLEAALPILLDHEGGYCNVPGDRGGETYCGIARNFHPDWPGWELIDAVKKNFRGKYLDEVLQGDHDLRSMVADFYREQYWKFDGIDSQVIATKIFDMAVNMGFKSAIRILQRALVSCGRSNSVDGNFGPITCANVNLTNGMVLLGVLRTSCAKYYEDIVAKHPDQKKFLKGWLRRASS